MNWFATISVGLLAAPVVGLITGERQASRDALGAPEHMQSPPKEFAGAVTAVGRGIAQALREFER